MAKTEAFYDLEIFLHGLGYLPEDVTEINIAKGSIVLNLKPVVIPLNREDDNA